MKSLTSWLVLMFMGMFWIFRVIVTLSAQYGSNFGGFVVFNNTIEIALIFLSLLCFILFAKRVVWGPIIYVLGYGGYFSSYIFSNVFPAITNGENLDIVIIQNSAIALLGLILGIVAIFDIAWEKTKMKHFSDDKTDWYFKNKDYDRKLDERADKNQYRTF